MCIRDRIIDPLDFGHPHLFAGLRNPTLKVLEGSGAHGTKANSIRALLRCHRDLSFNCLIRLAFILLNVTVSHSGTAEAEAEVRNLVTSESLASS